MFDSLGQHSTEPQRLDWSVIRFAEGKLAFTKKDAIMDVEGGRSVRDVADLLGDFRPTISTGNRETFIRNSGR